MPSAPRLVVEVRWGPLAGRKAVIEPGQALRVGAAEPADLVIPHDRTMSGPHFELAWDGVTCRVRDLASALGTLVDGLAVTADAPAEVAHTGWVRAGNTDFSVYVEARSAPRDVAPPPDEALVLATLRPLADAGRLFAVLDAARDPRIRRLLHEAAESSRSLYDGAAGDALAEDAPHLVQLRADSALLERLVREGWGRRWGIYLTSAAPFDAVRRHLRRFLMVAVEGPPRGRLYLRFYDPHVLRGVWQVLTPRQRALFGADLDELFAEGGEPLGLLGQRDRAA
jgi:hypothetical protein